MSEVKKRRPKRKYVRKQPPVVADVQTENASTQSETVEAPKITRRFTRRLIMLAIGGIGCAFGLGSFVVYYFTMNLMLGVTGVIVGIGGAFLCWHYWNKPDDFTTLAIGGIRKVTANCLNIYCDRVLFEDWKPKDAEIPFGFPKQLVNDKKYYWINITPLAFADATAKDLLEPFILPDQQYCDPEVFKQRVLNLPAHRRLFTRREKAAQVIKTALLVLTIIVLWILILTTTGG